VSTTNTRVHRLGKRATYQLNLPPDDPGFSSFLMPSFLLDGLARVAALTIIEDRFIPLAAPASIRRIDVYERANDFELARRHNPIELYVTPPNVALDLPDQTSRFVAVGPDGRIILQMKDILGIVMGYVDRDTGDYLAREQMEELKLQRSFLDLPGRV
jgi:hypothetical protein